MIKTRMVFALIYSGVLFMQVCCPLSRTLHTHRRFEVLHMGIIKSLLIARRVFTVGYLARDPNLRSTSKNISFSRDASALSKIQN